MMQENRLLYPEKQDLLPDKWPYHGAVRLNLTYKDGTVDRAPKVARIVCK